MFVGSAAAIIAVSLVAIGVEARAAVLPIGDEFNVSGNTVGFARSPEVLVTPSGFTVLWTAPWPTPFLGRGLWAKPFDKSGHAQSPELLVGTPVRPRPVDDPASRGYSVPEVASQPDGSFIVVWHDLSGRDGNGLGVFMRRVLANGELGLETQVNSSAVGVQGIPDIATNQDGDTLVVWVDEGNEDKAEIVAQLYNPQSVPQGGNFTLAAGLDMEPEEPKVTSLANGDFVVLWSAFGPDLDNEDIVSRIVQPDGTVRHEKRLNSRTESFQVSPDVSQWLDGFAAVWESAFFDGSDCAVALRRFDAEEHAIGKDVLVNSYFERCQRDATVASAPSGELVVSWNSFDFASDELGQDGDGRGMFAQAYDAQGEPIGTEFRVSPTTRHDQGDPGDENTIAFLDPQTFVIAWADSRKGNIGSIFARMFKLDQTGRVLCGDVTGNSLSLTANDALGVLRAVVIIGACDLCRCDGNGTGALEATDALAVLRAAVGLPFDFDCPACVE
jgi:hypothetical protein